jgi:hypothetical protein
MRVDEALRQVVREHAKHLASAEWFVVGYDEDLIEQPIALLQMGLAIYLDKPIVVIVPIGIKIPMNLRRLALRIVEYDPADPSTMSDALVRIRRTVVQ